MKKILIGLMLLSSTVFAQTDDYTTKTKKLILPEFQGGAVKGLGVDANGEVIIDNSYRNDSANIIREGTSPTLTKLTLTGTPGNNDAVSKTYVDNLALGIEFKGSAIAATTGNITLSGTQTVDNIALIGDQRVLVWRQTLSRENGVYLVKSGVWIRATDMDIWSEVLYSSVFIESGATNSGKIFTIDATTNVNIGGTIDVSNIVFTQTSSIPDITTTYPIKLASKILSLNYKSKLSLANDSLTIAVGAITNTEVASGIDAVKIANGSVTNTEFQYLDGVTSNINTTLVKYNDSIVSYNTRFGTKVDTASLAGRITATDTARWNAGGGLTGNAVLLTTDQTISGEKTFNDTIKGSNIILTLRDQLGLNVNNNPGYVTNGITIYDSTQNNNYDVDQNNAAIDILAKGGQSYYGINIEKDFGTGLYAEVNSGSSTAVAGYNNSESNYYNIGVEGYAYNGIGVQGISERRIGVKALSTDSTALYAESDNGLAGHFKNKVRIDDTLQVRNIVVTDSSSFNVKASEALKNYGDSSVIFALSTKNYKAAIIGEAKNSVGVVGASFGVPTYSSGVVGFATGYGVEGFGVGVDGIGGGFHSDDGIGVFARGDTCVFADYYGSNGEDGYAIFGKVAKYGNASLYPNAYAGVFEGKVKMKNRTNEDTALVVDGTATGKAAKFKGNVYVEGAYFLNGDTLQSGSELINNVVTLNTMQNIPISKTFTGEQVRIFQGGGTEVQPALEIRANTYETGIDVTSYGEGANAIIARASGDNGIGVYGGGSIGISGASDSIGISGKITGSGVSNSKAIYGKAYKFNEVGERGFAGYFDGAVSINGEVEISNSRNVDEYIEIKGGNVDITGEYLISGDPIAEAIGAVLLTTDQIIEGEKTFNAPIIINTEDLETTALDITYRADDAGISLSGTDGTGLVSSAFGYGNAIVGESENGVAVIITSQDSTALELESFGSEDTTLIVKSSSGKAASFHGNVYVEGNLDITGNYLINGSSVNTWTPVITNPTNIYRNSSVKIGGITNPTEKLEVTGNIKSDTLKSNILLANNSITSNTSGNILKFFTNGTNAVYGNISTGTNTGFSFNSNANSKLLEVTSDGILRLQGYSFPTTIPTINQLLTVTNVANKTLGWSTISADPYIQGNGITVANNIISLNTPTNITRISTNFSGDASGLGHTHFLDKVLTSPGTFGDSTSMKIPIITTTNDGRITGASSYTIPEATNIRSGLITSTEKTKLSGIAVGAEVNVQANYGETNNTSDSYIQNKPNLTIYSLKSDSVWSRVDSSLYRNSRVMIGSNSSPTEKLEVSGDIKGDTIIGTVGKFFKNININSIEKTPLKISNIFAINNIGNNNISIGDSAGCGYSYSPPVGSIFIGDSAGYNSDDVVNAVIIGRENRATGFGSIIIGTNAVGYEESVIVGTSALANVAGVSIGTSSNSGTNGVSIGTNAGHDSNNFGINIGNQAGSSAITEKSNYIGYLAGNNLSNSNAKYQNIIGYNSGNASYNYLGPNNIIIGTEITLPNNSTNSMNIGGVLYGTGLHTSSGNINSYSSNIPETGGKIGIGKIIPTETLDVLGNIKGDTIKGNFGKFLNTIYTSGDVDITGNYKINGIPILTAENAVLLTGDQVVEGNKQFNNIIKVGEVTIDGNTTLEDNVKIVMKNKFFQNYSNGIAIYDTTSIGGSSGIKFTSNRSYSNAINSYIEGPRATGIRSEVEGFAGTAIYVGDYSTNTSTSNFYESYGIDAYSNYNTAINAYSESLGIVSESPDSIAIKGISENGYSGWFDGKVKIKSSGILDTTLVVEESATGNAAKFKGNVDITDYLKVKNITYPTTDGDSGQFISTDGVGNLSFTSIPIATSTINGLFTSTEKTKLSGIEELAEKNVQADWTTSNSMFDSYILNKPDLSVYKLKNDSINDAGFATQNDLREYYTKSEIYSKTESDNKYSTSTFWNNTAGTLTPTEYPVRLDTITMGSSGVYPAEKIVYGTYYKNGSNNAVNLGNNVLSMALDATGNIHYKITSEIISSNYYVAISKSINGGITYSTYIALGAAGDGGSTNWNNYGNVKCSKDGSTVALTCGNGISNKLYISYDYGVNFTTITGIGTDYITALDISPMTGRVVLATGTSLYTYYSGNLVLKSTAAAYNTVIALKIKDDGIIYYGGANIYYKWDLSNVETNILSTTNTTTCCLDFDDTYLYVSDGTTIKRKTLNPESPFSIQYAGIGAITALFTASTGGIVYIQIGTNILKSINYATTFSQYYNIGSFPFTVLNSGTTLIPVNIQYSNNALKFISGKLQMPFNYQASEAKDVVTKDMIESLLPGGSGTGDITSIDVLPNSGLEGGGVSGAVGVALKISNIQNQKISLIGADRLAIHDDFDASLKYTSMNNIKSFTNTGVVTSVGLFSNNDLTVTSTPITSSGTINVDLKTQTNITPAKYNNANVTVNSKGIITNIEAGSTAGISAATDISLGGVQTWNGGGLKMLNNFIEVNSNRHAYTTAEVNDTISFWDYSNNAQRKTSIAQVLGLGSSTSSLTVRESDGNPSINNVGILEFGSGATVTNNSGVANVSFPEATPSNSGLMPNTYIEKLGVKTNVIKIDHDVAVSISPLLDINPTNISSLTYDISNNGITAGNTIMNGALGAVGVTGSLIAATSILLCGTAENYTSIGKTTIYVLNTTTSKMQILEYDFKHTYTTPYHSSDVTLYFNRRSGDVELNGITAIIASIQSLASVQYPIIAINGTLSSNNYKITVKSEYTIIKHN